MQKNTTTTKSSLVLTSYRPTHADALVHESVKYPTMCRRVPINEMNFILRIELILMLADARTNQILFPIIISNLF